MPSEEDSRRAKARRMGNVLEKYSRESEDCMPVPVGSQAEIIQITLAFNPGRQNDTLGLENEKRIGNQYRKENLMTNHSRPVGIRRRFMRVDSWIFLGLALGAFLSSRGLADTGKSMSLNREGYDHYKKGEFVEAEHIFRSAVKEDPSNAKANYNLACTLAILYSKTSCEYSRYQPLEFLEKAVALDPERRTKMQSDPDLEPVRRLFRYQRLLGLRIDRTGDVKKILLAITWYGPSHGATGPNFKLTFRPDGSVTFQDKVFTEESILRPDLPGTYKVDGPNITITLKQPRNGQTVFHGTLKEDGRIIFDGDLEYAWDSDDECSA